MVIELKEVKEKVALVHGYLYCRLCYPSYQSVNNVKSVMRLSVKDNFKLFMIKLLRGHQ